MPPAVASVSPCARPCCAKSHALGLSLLVMATLGVDRSAAEHPRFPVSWGKPPDEALGSLQDRVALAGGYGFGSSALSTWILRHIEQDQKARDIRFPPAFGQPPPVRWCLDCGSSLLPRLGKLPFGYGYGYSAEARSRWLIEKAREVYGEDVDAYESTASQTAAGLAAVATTTTAQHQNERRSDHKASALQEEFPSSWGHPPWDPLDVGPPRLGKGWGSRLPLPGGYGRGSVTLASWISRHMKLDADAGRVQYPPAFGKPPKAALAACVTDFVPLPRDCAQLPFGYGRGNGYLAAWLKSRARAVYGVEDDASDRSIELPLLL